MVNGQKSRKSLEMGTQSQKFKRTGKQCIQQQKSTWGGSVVTCSVPTLVSSLILEEVPYARWNKAIRVQDQIHQASAGASILQRWRLGQCLELEALSLGRISRSYPGGPGLTLCICTLVEGQQTIGRPVTLLIYFSIYSGTGEEMGDSKRCK